MAPAKNFKYPLFGCFDDSTLCILTFFLPCVTNGRTAELVDENGCLYGFSYAFLWCFVGACVRRKVREKYNIEGNYCFDLMAHLFCPLCALVQDNREVTVVSLVHHQSMSRS